MTAEQRLDSILWEQGLYGFSPFGAYDDKPMICFSESPPDHLRWLIATRGWPAWGLLFSRQYIYDIGGRPVWHTRSAQHAELERDQRRWAVRLDTTPGSRSDWLFEREWRVPVSAEQPFLPLDLNNVLGILIADPDWQPTLRLVPTGRLIDGTSGVPAYPSNPYAVSEFRPALPPLWEKMALRIYWEPTTKQFRDAVRR